MANIRDIKPRIIKVTLADGVEREMRYSLNAFAELEEMFGSVDDALKEMEKGKIKATRAILWAGLLDNDPSLTLDKAGSLVDMSNLAYLMEVITMAMTEDLPEETGETNPNE